MSYDIFVYGTLKQGHGNHCVMPNGSTFLGGGQYDGRMVSLGGFPGVLKGTTGRTTGELWNVPTIGRVDSLEGNGSFYTREQKTIQMDDGSLAEAWIYLLPEDEYKGFEPVENGEW